MLAAWLRIKFPHLCDGAIAASAPIAQFTSPCDAFGRIVTSGERGTNKWREIVTSALKWREQGCGSGSKLDTLKTKGVRLKKKINNKDTQLF